MKIVLTLALFCLSIITQAQEIEMADQMRSEGKIYVVLAVLVVILLGLFFYLFRIDQKLNKLENDQTGKS